jgi:hypothetical protein
MPWWWWREERLRLRPLYEPREACEGPRLRLRLMERREVRTSLRTAATSLADRAELLPRLLRGDLPRGERPRGDWREALLLLDMVTGQIGLGY